MKEYQKFSRIVNRTRYSVETATLIADDTFWDGHNHERSGRNTWLYRTPRGAFFIVTRSQWQGESDSLEPVTLERAIEMYENALSEHNESYQDAFPGVTVEDA